MRCKKLCCIILCMVFIFSSFSALSCVAFAQSTSYGENLVSNSSFENTSGWGFSGNMFRSNDRVNTGSYSLRCNARGAAVCVCSTASISVKPNTDYFLSGYVFRADNSAWAYIDMNDKSGELQLLDTSSYNKWQYVSGVWNSGSDTKLQVRLVVEPNYTINQHLKEGITGDVWFDDISLKEIKYDAYSETPPTLSASAKTYQLENSDISVSLAMDNNKEYLTSIINKENSYNWINKACEIPLVTDYVGGTFGWKLSNSTLDNAKPLQGSGEDACHTLTNTYTSNVSGVTMKSFWKIYPTGPIYHYSEIYNNTGKELKFDSASITAGEALFKIPDDVTIYSFNRSRYNNGWDGNFTKGVFENKVTQNLFFKSSVENSWLLSSGSLPFEVLHSDDHGLYVGYEWSYGDMLMRTQSDENILRFTATLGDSAEVIERENSDTLLVPPVFYGAYSGSVDDGSNNMKKWFYNHMMTKSLRENENEPLIEFHVPVFSENDLKNYLNNNDLQSYGVELTKMDYWWTVPTNAFDEVLEQQWNPYPSKWPNGMTYGKLVKSYYPKLKTSLYMADTYNGVDIGTKSGRQAQINALKERMNNWDIDYWRSDFDLLKPNNYANHEGLMYILDEMIKSDPDFRYEHCSAGGSLKDFSTLRRMTFMTMEDSGGALNHRMAFYANSYMINPIQLKFDMGFDWTSDADSGYINSNREKWTTYNVRTAMMGAMMVQNVGSYLSDIEKRELIKGWELYKTKQRPILRGCDVYHILPMPDSKNWDGMQFYNEELQKGSVFLFRDKNIGATDGSSKNIKLQGLDENSTYTLTFQDRTAQNVTKTGSELMTSGITVSGMTSVYDSEIIWIEKVGQKEPVRYLVGDTDGDGKIAIVDATHIQRDLAQIELLSDAGSLSADVNLDEIVSITDATLIQRYIAQLETAGSYCGEYLEVKDSVLPTQPETQPTVETKPVVVGNYLYYKNTDSWSDVYSYYWHPDNTSFTSWPGVPMENMGNDIYRIEVPSGVSMIIFNNGGNGAQTSDIAIDGMNKIYENNSWRDYTY